MKVKTVNDLNKKLIIKKKLFFLFIFIISIILFFFELFNSPKIATNTVASNYIDNSFKQTNYLDYRHWYLLSKNHKISNKKKIDYLQKSLSLTKKTNIKNQIIFEILLLDS